MKNTLTLLLVLFAIGLCAQVEYGTITYLRTSVLSWEPEGGDDEVQTPQDKEIQKMFAKMQASGAFNQTYEASFAPGEFNCIEQQKDPAEMSTESGDMVFIVATGGEDPSHYYTNTKSGEILNSDLIFDKRFLVSGKPKPVEWTLTGEKIPPSEMTASLDLMVAVGITENNDTITAGYAPSLPVDVGPLNYHGLPGAIITLEIPNENGKEKTVFRATNIELSSSPLDVDQPTEGKAISLDKFRAQREKKEKAMMREFRH